MELATGKVFITSQNHGYAVVSSSIDSAVARELFVNVNDRILKLLRSRVKSATGETRAHYQGMIYVLERSLFPSQKN